MKKGILILAITAFLVFDTYKDGEYSNMLKNSKKYFKMATYLFIGLSLFLFLKKHPNKSKDMLYNITEVAKYMPIDNNTKNIITPFFDMTNDNIYNKINGYKNLVNTKIHNNNNNNNSKLLNSGFTNKRCVSESKKKYVAAQQEWKCNECKMTLPSNYEVNHIIELQFGGSNHISNLEALCRNCHGQKTIQHKIIN